MGVLNEITHEKSYEQYLQHNTGYLLLLLILLTLLARSNKKMLFPVKGLVNNQVFICEHHKMTNPYSIRPPNFCLLYKSEAKKYQT